MSSSPATIRQKIGRILTPFYMAYFRQARGMTLGVRAAVLDGDNKVFLVKHTYVPGWYLPGGGIETNETSEQALARELSEEGHIILTGPAMLQGLYWNRETSSRDHVAFYVARDFTQDKVRQADREIAEARFFALDGLPENTTAATRRRLDEIAGLRAPDGFW